ncbi:MAG: hypothetical protein A2V76_06385 [Candidatus Aminicenantes bacterium RBG_16_63_14]|nr:MAG: hypothetical protein A2V76_06385 [Candidatus Aminicenantes bacterium RBG_16_63_14]
MNGRIRAKRSALILGFVAGAGILILAYGVMCLAIGAGVDDALEKARGRFSENDTDGLVAMMNSSDIPLKDRNLAVWALGQLGDTRATASLEMLLTGKPCDHASAVCQRGLKKAIRQCRGGVNISSWAWKPFVL